MADKVKESPLEWLWQGWIPQGSTTVLDCDFGQAKTALVAAIVAAVTTGKPLLTPEGGATPRGNVLILNDADSVESTIVPSLRVAGADLQRVDIVQEIVCEDGSRDLPVIPDHLPLLERVVARCQAKLVIFDPLVAYFSERYNARKNQHVGKMLMHLADFGCRNGCAVLNIRNYIGFMDQARSVIQLSQGNRDQTLWHLVHKKCSLGPLQSNLSFRLVPVGSHLGGPWVALASTEALECQS
jgi:putative DNA primase/helicase